MTKDTNTDREAIENDLLHIVSQLPFVERGRTINPRMLSELTGYILTLRGEAVDALLDKIGANSPKDRNHPHKMFSNHLVEAYADGYDKANVQWRALLRRYRVGKGEV